MLMKNHLNMIHKKWTT